MSLATAAIAAAPMFAQAQTNYDNYYDDYYDSYDYDTYDYDYDSDAADAAAAAFGIGFLIFAGIAGLIGLVFAIFNIWMIIDCSKREFENRTMWLVILIVGFFVGFGWLASIIYFFTVKRKNIGAKPMASMPPAQPMQK